MSKILHVAPSPHVKGSYSIEKLMYGVVLAMVPALIVSFIYFGLAALIVTVVSVASCVLTEYVIQKYVLKVPVTIGDGSAIVTGILLGFNLPAILPLHLIIMGGVVSIAVAKLSFGGLGNNPFNPALVGRVFLLISFPVQMTSYPISKGLSTSYVDAETGATPLAILKEGIKKGTPVSDLMGDVPTHTDLFLGNMGGSLGEIAGIALVLGLVYMLIRKVITWHIPITVIATIFIFTGILWLVNPESNADPIFHLLTGGVLLGAIFMATDYVTSPMTHKAMIIYGIGIGVITVVIRVYGAYPEGISFAILIMNAFVPLLNQYIKPKRFGEEIKHG
jgi:electron transport complex protein RnfD